MFLRNSLSDAGSEYLSVAGGSQRENGPEVALTAQKWGKATAGGQKSFSVSRSGRLRN